MLSSILKHRVHPSSPPRLADAAPNLPALVLILATCGEAAVIRVPADQRTIQAGIDVAAEGDTVLVAPGTYYEALDFLGKEITVTGVAPTDTSIVSGTIVDAQSSYDNPKSVVSFVNGEGIGATLSGLTLTGGMGTGTPGNTVGGGVVCRNASPRLEHLVVRNNAAFGNGVNGRGGGIYLDGGASSISRCRVLANTAEDQGGGIYIGDAEGTSIQGCLIRNNESLERGGGGIFVRRGFSAITLCWIEANYVHRSGGGMTLTQFASVTVSSCVFTKNYALESGGGVFSNWGSTGSLVQCTVFANDSEQSGGGVFAQFGNGAMSLSNCIVWENEHEDVVDVSDSLSISYCDIDGGWNGNGNIDADPLFVNPENGDYHLGLDSPCVDAGDPATFDACMPPGLGGPRADMGAYGGADNCGWTEPCDMPTLLREAEPDSMYVNDTTTAAWTIEACPDDAAVFSLYPACAWLEFTPSSGLVPADSSIEVILDYDGTGLAPGDHTCDVTITWDDTLDINELVSVAVISPLDLARTGEPDFLYPDESAEAEWQVTNLSAQNDLVVDIAESCSWLELSPSALIVPPSSTLSTSAIFDATDLNTGIYDCEATLVYADSFEVIAPVTLNVISPLGDIVRIYEPDTMYLGDSAEGSWEIWNLSAQVPLTVDFDPGCAWLELAPDPLVIPADTSAIVTLTYDTGGLVPGDHECPVTLTYADSLEIELPVTLTTVSPFTVIVTDSPDYARQGRKLRWEFTITNLTDRERTVDAWFDAYLWDGRPHPSNPVLGPFMDIIFAPGDVASFFARVKIPPEAPLASPYRMCTVLGDYPDEWASDCFEFAIQP